MIAALLARIAPYKLFIEIGVACAALFFIMNAWHEHEQKIEDRGAAKQAQIDAKAVADAQAALLEWQRMYNMQIEANNKDQKDRDEKIATAAAATAAAATRVQDSSRSLAAAANALSPDALRDAAGALRQVSVECAARAERLGERLGTVAADAERLNAEKAKLIGAWPKPANMQQPK